MPAWIHELVVAPLALALAYRHASRALGGARAAVELLALCAYGFALEWVAMAVFASHRYGAEWALAPAGVPIAIAAVWAAVITSAMALAVRAGAAAPLRRALLAATLGIALDLLMEPVAVRLGLWEWTPPGPWLAVPIGNFVGWAVIVGGYTFGAERWAGQGRLATETARRLALAAGAIALLIAVGLVWTRLGAEALFARGAGWAAWLALLAAPLALGVRARAIASGPEPTLAERLGRTRGAGPTAVFTLVGLTFAIDALLLGGHELFAVALGSALVLGVVLGKRAPDSLGRERLGGEPVWARGGPDPPEFST
jgi:hypothetical protein